MAWTFAGQWGPEAIIDHRGNAQRGAKVYVYEPGTENLATLWESRDKNTEADNPVEVDSKGNLKLFADPGLYRAEVYRDGVKRFEFDVAVSGELALAEGEFLRGAGSGPALEAIDSGTFAKAQDADATITVGDGGDHSNLQEALTAASKLHASFGVTVDINMLSGFVADQQVVCRNIVLWFCTLRSEDATVSIDRSAMSSATGVDGNPFFVVREAQGPTIATLFIMDGSGTQNDQRGFQVAHGWLEFASGAGAQGAVRNLDVHQLGNVNAHSADFANALMHGVRIANGGSAHLRSADISNAANDGLVVGSGGLVTATDAIITGAGDEGARLSDCIVSLQGADLSGAGGHGLRALNGAHVNASNANTRMGGSDSSDDTVVESGATIIADGLTGGTSQVRNVLTGNGIIHDASAAMGVQPAQVTDRPHTLDPRLPGTNDRTVGPAGRQWLGKVMGRGTIDAIWIRVGAQAGNIDVAVIAPDRTVKASSGSTSTPSAGWSAIPLSESVDVEVGDYLAVAGDMNAIELRAADEDDTNVGVGAGFAFRTSSEAFPFGSSLASGTVECLTTFVLVGRPA